MSDIATTWNAGSSLGDWTLTLPNQQLWTDQNGNSILDEQAQPIGSIFSPGGDLVGGNDLLTAVLISLFSDAEAGADDAIPDRSDDRRGWWAGPIGSKLWLRRRSKATPSVAALVKDDIAQALAWLIEDDVVAAVDVVTEWTQSSMLGVAVTLRRADGARMALAFSRVWENV